MVREVTAASVEKPDDALPLEIPWICDENPERVVHVHSDPSRGIDCLLESAFHDICQRAVTSSLGQCRSGVNSTCEW